MDWGAKCWWSPLHMSARTLVCVHKGMTLSDTMVGWWSWWTANLLQMLQWWAVSVMFSIHAVDKFLAVHFGCAWEGCHFIVVAAKSCNLYACLLLWTLTLPLVVVVTAECFSLQWHTGWVQKRCKQQPCWSTRPWRRRLWPCTGVNLWLCSRSTSSRGHLWLSGCLPEERWATEGIRLCGSAWKAWLCCRRAFGDRKELCGLIEDAYWPLYWSFAEPLWCGDRKDYFHQPPSEWFGQFRDAGWFVALGHSKLKDI